MESKYPQRWAIGHEDRGAPAKCIEHLPVEIQRQIMFCLPSLASLGTLIRTSPVFYSLFKCEPRNFIANCLIIVLGNAFLDACAVQAAMQDDFQKQRRDAMKMRRESSIVWPFLESYRKKVEELPCDTWIHSISLPDAVKMAMFHASTVEPLVEQYASWALGNVRTPVKQSNALSTTERMRIQRAMYRFQLLCDVFGNRLKDDNLSTNRPRQLGCLRFLSSYEPWEIEEILCINAFFQEQYETIPSQIYEDINPNSNRLTSHTALGGPGEVFGLEQGRTRGFSLNFLVSQGLPLLAKVLAIQDHAELVDTLRGNIHHSAADAWLDDITGNTDMHQRWERSYSERDAAQDEGRPMPYRGDDQDSPPLAWVLIWSETYSNLFGVFIPKPLRRWGYIMWDAQRLGETGAKDVLMREWHEMWQGGDYRESLRAWGNNRG